MSFYDLAKAERIVLTGEIAHHIEEDLLNGQMKRIRSYYGDEDTYIRKAAYLATGRIYLAQENLRQPILEMLNFLLQDQDFKIRQTTINAAGEIGKKDFETVQSFFDMGLFDVHHSPRNAVIGSIKKMGEVNPGPVLLWAETYLHHKDKEIRREICHGIELRGRKHPMDILPMLKTLEFDKTARVRNTLVHVIGQIAYKKGCLEMVADHLKGWENKTLVKEAITEIIDVHYRYRNFAVKTQEEARQYLSKHLPDEKYGGSGL